MSKKVALAFNVTFGNYEGNYEDGTADEDVVFAANAIFDVLEKLGHKVEKVEIASFNDVIKTDWKKFDIVFNLVESLDGLSSKEMCFPAYLDMIGVRYTGSGAFSLINCLNKATTKSLLISEGIGTPRYAVAKYGKKVDLDIVKKLNFPIIIKPVAEDASLGIHIDSVIYERDLEKITKKVAYLHNTFRHDALIEEFINGREFNVSMLEDEKGNVQVLPIAELCYKEMPDHLPKICSYNGKWMENSPDYHGSTPIFNFKISKKLEELVIDSCVRAFKLLQLRGYGRVDLRTQNNKSYILEVNPNPCISPTGGFTTAARNAGLDYEKMINQILHAGK